MTERVRAKIHIAVYALMRSTLRSWAPYLTDAGCSYKQACERKLCYWCSSTAWHDVCT